VERRSGITRVEASGVNARCTTSRSNIRARLDFSNIRARLDFPSAARVRHLDGGCDAIARSIGWMFEPGSISPVDRMNIRAWLDFSAGREVRVRLEFPHTLVR